MNGITLNLKYPAIPENASRLASIIVAAAKKIDKVDLDYSAGSIAYIDAIVMRFRKEGLKPESIGETLFSFGCYVGEVLVRECGAKWVLTDSTPMARLSSSPMILELQSGNFCNPIDRVFKCFEEGSAESIVDFYRVFSAF